VISGTKGTEALGMQMHFDTPASCPLPDILESGLMVEESVHPKRTLNVMHTLICNFGTGLRQLQELQQMSVQLDSTVSPANAHVCLVWVAIPASSLCLCAVLCHYTS